MTDPEIEVHSHLPCRICGGELLFSMRIPTSVTWGGQRIDGHRTATLCPHCHRDDPAAQGVLAYFTVHKRITQETIQDAGGVLREWLDHVIANPPVYTDEDLDEDIRRWESGEM